MRDSHWKLVLTYQSPELPVRQACLLTEKLVQQLAHDHRVRGADVTVTAESSVIFVPTAKLAQVSEGCRNQFDRAFMSILVERLSAANLRLSGV